MCEVVVLLATYNGQKYLREQIDSVLNQTGVNVRLFVKDDVSTDDTVKILESYKNKGLLEYYVGEKNLGPAQTFLDLIFSSPTAEYYAFCDQDDVWSKEKLAVAIEAIGGTERPCLYHGFAARVNEALVEIPFTPYKIKHTLGSALVTSSTGCTMVFNNSLMIILRSYRPRIVEMHDAWVYRVAYAMKAKVIYDQKSYIKYRQHDNNVSGGMMSFRDKLYRMLIINNKLRQKTALELIEGFGPMLGDNERDLISLLAYYQLSLFKKIELLFNKEISVYKWKTNVQYKILILINRM